jgi:hypothetical protein
MATSKGCKTLRAYAENASLAAFAAALKTPESSALTGALTGAMPLRAAVTVAFAPGGGAPFRTLALPCDPAGADFLALCAACAPQAPPAAAGARALPAGAKGRGRERALPAGAHALPAASFRTSFALAEHGEVLHAVRTIMAPEAPGVSATLRELVVVPPGACAAPPELEPGALGSLTVSLSLPTARAGGAAAAGGARLVEARWVALRAGAEAVEAAEAAHSVQLVYSLTAAPPASLCAGAAAPPAAAALAALLASPGFMPDGGRLGAPLLGTYEHVSAAAEVGGSAFVEAQLRGPDAALAGALRALGLAWSVARVYHARAAARRRAQVLTGPPKAELVERIVDDGYVEGEDDGEEDPFGFGEYVEYEDSNFEAGFFQRAGAAACAGVRWLGGSSAAAFRDRQVVGRYLGKDDEHFDDFDDRPRRLMRDVRAGLAALVEVPPWGERGGGAAAAAGGGEAPAPPTAAKRARG